MNCHKRIISGTMFVALFTISCSGGEQYSLNSKETVSKYFQYLKAGDVKLMDSLFFRIPVMDKNKEDWLALLNRASSKVKEDQLAWEVICSRELDETAVVIVNQTMKRGKAHADPDTIFLVKANNIWLLLPDTIAYNAKQEVRKAMSKTQVSDRHVLKKWAIGEIRGYTTECNQST